MKSLTLPNGDHVYYIDKLSALDIYEEIYEDNDYLRFGLEIKDRNVIFDVGANIGLFSSFISKKAKDLLLFAFEPVPIIFKVLEANIKNLPSEVKAFNIGLGDTNKKIEIHYYPRVSADSVITPFDWDLKVRLFLENYDNIVVDFIPLAKIIPKFLRKTVVKTGLKRLYKSEMVECNIRRLSDIIKENKVCQIDLLKIDAENYEWEVLMGIDDNDWEIIRQISMEVHTHIKGGENLLENVINLLKEKQYQIKVEKDSRFGNLGVFMLYAKKI